MKCRLDPVDASRLLGQDHHRAGRDHEDLTQRAHQRTLGIGADQPRAAHLALAQDAPSMRRATSRCAVGEARPARSARSVMLSSSPVSKRVESRRA